MISPAADRRRPPVDVRGRAKGALRVFPSDSVLLPLTAGKLLVSRGHALFCRVPSDQVEAVAAHLAHALDARALPPELLRELERHGFGGPPRPSRPAVPTVQIQLTNACNLSCSYCCTASGEARRDEVDRATLESVIDQVSAELGPGTSVSLLGGEPLLVSWSVDLASLVLDRGLCLTLFTNGVGLANGEIAEQVAALTRRGAQIRVSLAGPTAHTCDGLSGAPRFASVVKGLELLAAAGGTAIVDLMLVPQNACDVAAHLTDLRRQLPPGTRITLGLLYPGGRETGEHVFPSRAQVEESLDRVAFEAGETIAASSPSPLTYRRKGCSCALGHHLHVRSDGALFTCFKMEEKVGDLRTTTFAEALRAVRASPHPAVSLPACRECALATLCGGGCRTDNLQYTGNADDPPCGPWRVRVLSELLAEDRVSALEWPLGHLVAEARHRGFGPLPDLSIAPVGP